MRATEPKVKIRLRGVSKSFSGKVVLDGLDLDDLRRASRSSCSAARARGKSVLLKHMIGLMKPDSGTIEVDGVELASLKGPELTAVPAPLRDGLPGGRALRLDDGLGQRRLPAAARQVGRGADRRAGGGLPRVGPPRGSRAEDARRALGRHAAPRRLRARHRDRAGDPALRRADHRPRPGDQGGDRRPDPRAAGEAQLDGGHHHARPRQRLPHRRPHRAALPGQDRRLRAPRGVPRARRRARSAVHPRAAHRAARASRSPETKDVPDHQSRNLHDPRAGGRRLADPQDRGLEPVRGAGAPRGRHLRFGDRTRRQGGGAGGRRARRPGGRHPPRGPAGARHAADRPPLWF